MAKVIAWSQEALDDIEAIAEYISRNSVYHAQRVVEEIITITEAIQNQPRMGRIVPELSEEHIREHFIYSYRIIYEIMDKRVVILAVIHGRRLLETIESRFE